MGISKVKAFFSLISLITKIENKRKMIKKTRKISDANVIKNFVDEFDITAISSNEKSINKINAIITKLSKSARKLINK